MKRFFLFVGMMISLSAMSQNTISSSNGKSGFCPGDSLTLTANLTGGTPYTWLFNGSPLSDTTASIVVKNAGDYVAISGVDTTSTFTVTTFSAPTASITAAASTTFCDGGDVTLTASGGASYLWSNSDTATSISVSTSGSYTVTATDTNGCSATSSATVVTVNPLPTVSITASGATTFCANDSVTLSASGANTYVWSSSETTTSIVVKTGGTYKVTGTDSNGCSATSSATDVTVNALPTVSISASGATSFCAGDSVTLTVSGNMIQWNTGDTTASITVFNSGHYEAMVTDSNGCMGSDHKMVSVSTPLNLSIAASGATTFCAGNSVQLYGSLNGGSWNTGATTDTITVSTAGSYYITASNICGADTSNMIDVVVNALPTVSISTSGATSFCAGDSVILTVSGNMIQWSTGDTTTSITVFNSGHYEAMVTDSNGCMASDHKMVSVSTPLNLNIAASGSTTFCAGNSVQLYGSLNGGSWNTGATTDTITVSTAGSYYITASNICGVDTSNMIDVVVNALPTADTVVAASSTTFCQGGSVVLSSGMAGTWSTGDTSATITVSTAGNYYITTTDSNGCSINSASVAVVVNANPTPSISLSKGPAICSGDSIDLSISNTGTWSTGDTSASIRVSSAGTYSVTVVDSNGCIGSTSATITVDTLISGLSVTASGNTTFCQGGSVVLTRNNASGAWNSGDTSNAITVSTSGTYYISAGNACGTDTSNVVNVVVNSNPTASVISAVTSPSFCQGDSVFLLSNQVGVWNTGDRDSVILVFGSGNYSQTITDSNGCSATSNVIHTIVNALPATPTITAMGNTTFCQGDSVVLKSSDRGNWGSVVDTQLVVRTAGSFTVTVTDTNGCSAVSLPISTSVNALPAVPVISANSILVFCAGRTVTLTSTAPGLWSNTAQGDSIVVGSSGNYTVTVTDSNGCSSTSLPVTVTVKATPATPTISPTSATICAGDSVLLQSSAIGNWSPSGPSASPFFVVRAAGTYTVTVNDTNGCSATSLPATINVTPRPAKPTVTASRDTLTSSVALGNQWYNVTSGLIAGATNQKYVIAATGRYYTKLTQNGCSINSDTLLVIKVGVNDLTAETWKVYPNPATEKVYLSREGMGKQTVVSIFDAAGRMVKNQVLVSGQMNTEIEVSDLNNGIYYIRLVNENQVKSLPLMIQH